VFEELERLAAAKETFDTSLADPPPFVRARKDLEPVPRPIASSRVWRPAVVAPRDFCFWLHARQYFAGGVSPRMRRRHRACEPPMRIDRQAGAGPDHPVHPMLPETAYLKANVYALD